ncbi:MAG: 2-succinyl-5-enolpyruvyl-6-hydroxy-3-cyclohexene-1-carboxylic-acid synthase [Raoultibacter sp.]
MIKSETSTESALFLSVFFDELARLGVREVVISPGSRSTPLAMVAFEASRRGDCPVRLFIDVDERGAAFFALGLAKASGRPVCLICTSGTATANYYPAVLEAESSRVPLVLLTGDRPPRLQGLGAPQTCDQIKLYGDHVRFFQQMPLPASDDASLAYARQMAREAYIQAQGPLGSAGGAPVHLNFPFDEPLKPNLVAEGLFVTGRSALLDTAPAIMRATQRLSCSQTATIEGLLATHRSIVLCGEGSCASLEEERTLLAWAHKANLPLLADPLSGLRSVDDPLVIDNYDNIFGKVDCPEFNLVIRFGRYPVSKNTTMALARTNSVQVVVDPVQTRDFNAATDLFVQMTPGDFVGSLLEGTPLCGSEQSIGARQWISRNDAERARIEAVAAVSDGFEGAFVHALLECVPRDSLLFSANSMAVRALDTFYVKGDKRLRVLCNRGLNGIDGTLSTALGAAQIFEHATFLTGDLTLLHDLPAFALQQEMLVHQAQAGYDVPHVVVVLLNNHGGGIFDMLPQKSDEEYFERLFITPNVVDFASIAAGFGLPYRCVSTASDLVDVYPQMALAPGISLIEIEVPLAGVSQRYAPYQ